MPTGIWNKPGPLSPSEWGRVRLHTYYTDRTLSQSPLLEPAARVASMHHERLDGSGYHRGASASMLSLPARVLAAADVYRALTEDRPHRSALDESAAARELQRGAERGALDRQAVRAVCEAAGHRIKKRASDWPAGLSDREVEVLATWRAGVRRRKSPSFCSFRPALCTPMWSTCMKRLESRPARPPRSLRWNMTSWRPERKYPVQ